MKEVIHGHIWSGKINGDERESATRTASLPGVPGWQRFCGKRQPWSLAVSAGEERQ